MIDRNHDLSISAQAKLLGISRGTVYYLPRPLSDADLALMRRIDELHLQHPFMGARMLRDQLAREGTHVGRRHLRTLMRRMGIEALAPQPGTSKAAPSSLSDLENPLKTPLICYLLHSVKAIIYVVQ